MSDQVDRVLDAQDEVNINLRLPRVKREDFKDFCAKHSTDKKKITTTSMILAFIDDCIMSGKKLDKGGK